MSAQTQCDFTKMLFVIAPEPQHRDLSGSIMLEFTQPTGGYYTLGEYLNFCGHLQFRFVVLLQRNDTKTLKSD